MSAHVWPPSRPASAAVDLRRVLVAVLLLIVALLGAYWWGHRAPGDVDCSQVSYAEAQRILADDPSDRYDLDRDGDGVGCDWNK